MRQKTKQKIVDFIASKISLQGTQNKYQKLAIWAAYLLQPLIFHIILLASIAQSQFQFPYTSGYEMGLVMTRITISILSMYTNWAYLLPLIKTLQIINIYMLRTSFSALGLLFEFIAQMMVIIRKEKRYVNFDSRLENKFYGTKIFAIYILLLATFYTTQEEMNKTPSSVLFTSLIFYIASCLDQIYSYRTKEILRTLALCPIMMAIYFLCEPLVPALTTFGLVAHTIVSLAILCAIMTYAVMTDYTYHNPILFKKIINLQSRDKLAYIWALICFVQAPTYNQLVCYIKTHQSKCFNPLCPLNSSITHAAHLSQQIILKSLKIYLKKCLQRFASENDEIRRLFIYYRQQDDPKITYLLKQTDLYEKIEQLRIVKNLSTYNDPSLEYEQMKEIEEETFLKVKLFLNHYEYFLAYLNKDVIKLQTSEEIISELLKLKNYFLSFKPNVDEEKDPKQSHSAPKVIKNSQGYEQLETQTIPFKKMTVKTILLVNFMRKVYFNLPSLQKEQFTSKKLTYINEDIEQGAILVISAESYNLGKVMNWNSMAQKILLYPTKQMRQKYINDLIPQPLHKHHEEVLMKGALRIQLGEPSKQISTLIFCFSKPNYVEVFETKIAGTHSISGNKWIIQLHQHFDKQSIIIVDEYKNIIGVNKNAVFFGFDLTVVGQQIDQQVFQRVVKGKKQKVILSTGVQPIQGLKMEKETQWQLVQTTRALQGMQKYFIIQIRQTHQIEKTTLSRYSKHQSTIVPPQNFVPQCDNGFQFSFDPFQLKYTNMMIPSHSSSDLELVWQSNRQIEEGSNVEFQQNGEIQERKLIKYGDNIHEMIYFDRKLQFKENFEQSTQFETHPNYLPGAKMVINNRGLMKININKENFIQNVNKIKNKTPSFVYKLAALFIILSIICIICLSIRLVYFNKIYESSRQKQLVNMKIIDRKNLISNIGSLAVYMVTNSTYPNIWERYLTNGWTFQQLFVGIEYTNGEINKLNGDIGLLVSKGYIVNGKVRTLASYFEALSIQASGRASGKLNLTQFISEIVNQVSVIENNIQMDTQTYYQNLHSSFEQTILIIDIVQLVSCLIIFILMHFLLRKTYMERVYLFKSLTVIQEEEIARILACLNQQRQFIKNNQLDSIPMEQNYQDTPETQNIKHQKKLIFSYFNSKIVLFYIFICINIIAAAFIFLLSNHSLNLTENIELITPFVNITGQQRDSMTKLYLKTITNIENDTAAALMRNVRMFEKNKKGVIDSLIEKQLSDGFMKFYNGIWFSPCTMLQVSDQCNSLFSGILSDNLDYNYVYIMTEIQKINDYRTQISVSDDTLFIRDANLEIQKSFKKINFLLFDFMIRLQQKVSPNLESEVDYLYGTVEKDNLSIFLVALIWIIVLTAILAYSLYKIKSLSYQTLEMLSTAMPACVLMRNQYFVEWYQQKFRSVY